MKFLFSLLTCLETTEGILANNVSRMQYLRFFPHYFHSLLIDSFFSSPSCSNIRHHLVEEPWVSVQIRTLQGWPCHVALMWYVSVAWCVSVNVSCPCVYIYIWYMYRCIHVCIYVHGHILSTNLRVVEPCKIQGGLRARARNFCFLCVVHVCNRFWESAVEYMVSSCWSFPKSHKIRSFGWHVNKTSWSFRYPVGHWLDPTCRQMG